MGTLSPKPIICCNGEASSMAHAGPSGRKAYADDIDIP